MKGSLGHQHLIFYFVSVSTSIWPKMTEVLISRKDYLNPNNLVEGDLGKTSYEFLLSQMNDPLVPIKLYFFEEAAKKLNNFLVTFQTSCLHYFPVVSFIVDSLVNLVRSFVKRFILPHVS